MSYNLRTVCLKASSVLFLLLFLQSAHAQSKGRKNDKEYGVDRYPELEATLAQQGKLLGPDYVAMVWKDTLVFKKEAGDFNAKTEAPLASASKWLTTALIMVLVDEGKLTLDDKVSDYIPLFSTYGKNYITIRHCLSHFTGIQANQKLMDGKIESLETEAASFAKKEIQTNPGTEFRYSNAGAMIAGRIAEIVTKKKFDQLIKQKLFNPMGMSRTSFSTLDGSGIDPANGARSSANDYIRFLAMLLNNGKFNNKQVISEASVQEMRKLQASAEMVKYAPKGVTGFAHAMGSWSLEDKEGISTALASPGLFGVFPVVDWCRGYAMIFLPKALLSEQKQEPYLQLKGAVDGGVQVRCK